MRAVMSVVGKDRPGILAFVATECAKRTINIVDVTQKVQQDLFTMIMIVEVPEDLENMHKIADEFDELGKEQALRIHFRHEDIFNAMHTI